MIKTNKGFSLVELVIALGIIIIMTGAAALYLGDIYFRAQVTKSLEDMETIGKALLLHDTENGANLFETELPGYGPTAAVEYQEKDTLNNLLGVYLAVLPRDPWGGNYRVNSYAGWIGSYAADYKIGGTSKYERDIKFYYLPENLFVTKVRVEDNDDDGEISVGDSIMVYFSKSVRANVIPGGETKTADVRPATAANRTTQGDNAGGAPADGIFPPSIAAEASGDEGRFDERDLVIVQQDGTVINNGALTVAEAGTVGWSRPIDTPFTYDSFSRELLVNALTTGTNANATVDVLQIGSQVVIPTGIQGVAAPWNDAAFATTVNRSLKYVVWESSLGYRNGYKTPGQLAKAYLQQQAPDTAARTVLFKTLVD